MKFNEEEKKNVKEAINYNKSWLFQPNIFSNWLTILLHTIVKCENEIKRDFCRIVLSMFDTQFRNVFENVSDERLKQLLVDEDFLSLLSDDDMWEIMPEKMMFLNMLAYGQKWDDFESRYINSNIDNLLFMMIFSELTYRLYVSSQFNLYFNINSFASKLSLDNNVNLVDYCTNWNIIVSKDTQPFIKTIFSKKEILVGRLELTKILSFRKTKNIETFISKDKIHLYSKLIYYQSLVLDEIYSWTEVVNDNRMRRFHNHALEWKAWNKSDNKIFIHYFEKFLENFEYHDNKYQWFENVEIVEIILFLCQSSNFRYDVIQALYKEVFSRETYIKFFEIKINKLKMPVDEINLNMLIFIEIVDKYEMNYDSLECFMALFIFLAKIKWGVYNDKNKSGLK